jgi:hypothetical protein
VENGCIARRVSSHHNDGGVLAGVRIPGLARPVIALFARGTGCAPQACPEHFERRTGDDRLHEDFLLLSNATTLATIGTRRIPQMNYLSETSLEAKFAELTLYDVG